MDIKELFYISFIFWVVLDGLGNIPIVLSLLRSFDYKTQQKIIMRELFFSLLAMFFFYFFGMGFFNFLKVDQSALQISGGIILFLIAIRMIFADPAPPQERQRKEPYIVPIAVPAIAGPGILATLTIYGGKIGISKITIFLAIIIAWLATVPCLLLASFLKKWLGENGLVAIERLFGYLIILLGTQMVHDGILAFFKS